MITTIPICTCPGHNRVVHLYGCPKHNPVTCPICQEPAQLVAVFE